MSKIILKKAVSNALVLSGGGTRVFAQLGALQVLEDEGISFDAIAGTSVGALFAVCYAAGKSLHDITTYFMKISFFKLLRPKWGAIMLDTEQVVNEVLAFAGVTSFSELSVPVFINAVNINDGVERCFSSGKLKPALQASIAVPGIFAPVKIGKKYYVDGGTAHILPIHLLPKSKCVYAININFKFEKITEKSSSLQVLQNAMFCLQKQSILKFLKSVIYIEPNLDAFGFYDYSLASKNKMFKQGQMATRRALKKARLAKC